MKPFVTTKIPLKTGAMSVYPYSDWLEAQYTFKSAFDEVVCGAVHHGHILFVPRESVPYAAPSNDFRTEQCIGAFNCTLEFRHEQELLCQQSLSLLKEGRNHIFEAPTGWGKTVAGGWIGCQLGQPTMIVVTKEDLVHQWKESLTHILNVPANQIGQVQQDVCEWEGKRFVIGMVQSLILPDRYPKEMYQYFGLLILDEVHLMAAECFVRSCQMFPAKYRLGFSATPNRRDGKTKLLHWHIGPTMVKGKIIAMKPKVLVRQTGWHIPTRRVNGSWEQVIPYKPGRMMLVTKAMAASDTRNMEIVNFVKQSYQAGRTILIMSDLREKHLNRLFQMLTGEGIPGNEIGFYVGGMKKEELKITKTRRVVLGTYAMCATGTDCPVWDTLVLATPRAEIKQSIGRVLRYLDHKRQPIILDLVDGNSIFQGFHLARCKQYYGIGATVVKIGAG